jgi:hypothetical protein
MGEIRLSVGQVNISNYLMVNVREVGNPSVIVQSQVIPPPVPASFNLLFSGLADVVHYVDFRSSADGISLGLLLGTFVYDVKNEIFISEMRFYTVDGGGPNDPTASDSSITDPYLNGKIVSTVYREGFRPLRPAVEFDQVGDTINFLTPQLQLFGSLETWVVEIVYKTVVPAGGAGAFPADIIELTADTSLVDIHQNKLMEINGSGLQLTVTMPAFTTIPEGTKYAFQTDHGAQRTVAIIIDPGSVNFAWVDGVQRTTLFMGKGEYLEIIKKGGYMRVLDWRNGDHSRVGELVYKEIPPINGVTHQGMWDDIAGYPRLYNWYILNLDPSYFGSGSYPATPSGANRHKWCIDLVNGKIWFPDLGGVFLRVTDSNGDIDTDRPAGDRKPGTYQADGQGPASVRTVSFTGQGIGKNGVSTYAGFLATLGDGGLVASDTASGTNNNNARTATWDVNATASENRPKNVNMNIYRII